MLPKQTPAARAAARRKIPVDPRIARLRVLMLGEGSRAAALRAKGIGASEPVPGRDVAEQALSASDAPSPATLATLARRDHLPSALKFLLSALPPRVHRTSVIDFLALTPGPLRNSRTAVFIGKHEINRADPVALDDFDPATLAGRVGLCLLEQPPAPWPDLTREERAGLMLALIYRVRAVS
jgi:hypothetical protein